MGGILRANLAVLETALASTGVAFRFGGHALYENESPPRVTWVPTQDPLDDRDTKRLAARLGTGYRSVKTRHASVSAHCWGVSYDQAEAMLHNLVSVLANQFGATHDLGTADWVQVWDNDTDLGWVVTLPISFHVPVLAELVALPLTEEQESSQPNPTTTLTVVANDPADGEVTASIGTYTFEQPTTA